MRTLLLTISLLFSLMLRAQDAKEILQKSLDAVNALEQASYRTEILQTNFVNGDTIRYDAGCVLKRIKDDSIAGMYYYFSTANDGFYKYNGTAFYSFTRDYYDFILRYPAGEAPGKSKAGSLNRTSVHELTSLVFYTNSMFKSGEEIKSFLDDLAAPKSKGAITLKVISDTLADGVKCYGFRVSKPRKNFSYNRLILVDQHNFLPVVVIKDFRGGGVSFNKESLSVGQFTSVKYVKIKESAPRFDYLMSEKSLPKKVEVRDYNDIKEPFRIGDQAPSLAIPVTSTGKLVSTDSLKGRILVLAFTSTSCNHSTESNNVIRELSRKYGERTDVIFINVFSSSADSREKVEKYYKKNSLEGYTLFYSTGIENTWGILGYPNFFLIDRHSRIAYFQRGYSNDLERILSNQIDDCLGKP